MRMPGSERLTQPSMVLLGTLNLMHGTAGRTLLRYPGGRRGRDANRGAVKAWVDARSHKSNERTPILTKGVRWPAH
jgi:hypothetical protein